MFYLFGYTSLGQIVSYIECMDTSLQTPPVGGGFVDVAEKSTYPLDFMTQNYVLSGAIVPCTANPAVANKTTFTANGIDEVIITGIPNGAIAKVAGVVTAGPETITDGELVVTSNTVGTILVSLSLIPNYSPWSVKLNAS